MKLQYIKITQKGETFLLTKMNALELKKYVNFHFRNPYINQSHKDFISFNDYINHLNRKGLQIQSDPDGIQRRININKINDICKTMSMVSEIMPSAVLLCLDFKTNDDMLNYLDNEIPKITSDWGNLELSDNILFQVIDGQHRLAGIFSCDEKIMREIEIPIILLLDSTRDMIAKIFSDINGKQTKVNNSVILDLLEERKPSEEEQQIDKLLHNICKQLNENIDSPFYHHIKMLGYGFGTISQSFLVSGLREVLRKINKSCDATFFNNIYLYFSAIQEIFSKFWPVPIDKKNFNQEKFVSYSKQKMQHHNQIMKTNGIGALLKIFPSLINMIDYDCDDINKLYTQYKNILLKISDFDWENNENVKLGSGEKTQKIIANVLLAKIYEGV